MRLNPEEITLQPVPGPRPTSSLEAGTLETLKLVVSRNYNINTTAGIGPEGTKVGEVVLAAGFMGRRVGRVGHRSPASTT